ncbi:MAG TPA: S1 RNA-binding domain-containing protein [bacterium]|jgi:ribosomal protein S1|nr:MAG: 30S ribosomal protein S1 [Parcubacteria group bacterium ADurb.Bin016]HNQ45101.1 S1 RNA-binding domain-containing protein [bacterium]HNU89776.1 S1 RNA-binding domain-containing protein [bacterium]HPU92074.1 S1 RNA-binding domain-containing protein [bacterium]HPX64540.1 S1 RNA-binding domain-containing protein [bacterium]
MSQIKNDKEEFTKLLDHDPVAIPKIGDNVSGRIISASKSEIKVDIGGVMTGVIRGRELYFNTNEYAKLPAGTEIEATVVDLDNENGEVELSFRHIDEQKAWSLIQKSYNDKTNIRVRILDANRGGLIVASSQLTGFLPVSQLAPNNYPRVSGGDKTKILEKLKTLVGSELEVKIMAIDENEKKFIASEKDAWQDKQKDVISRYKVGSTVEGTITAITGFGIFINFDNDLEGLIHISELAWQRIDDINELYKIGDKIKAEIISIDGSKIFLSAKKLINDPWRDVAKKYKIGQKVSGLVLKVNPFGLFVELDKDIHGLAHVSQLTLKPGQKITDVYSPNSKAEFTIISLEPENHRLGLASADKKPQKASSSVNLTEDKKTDNQETKDSKETTVKKTTTKKPAPKKTVPAKTK